MATLLRDELALLNETANAASHVFTVASGKNAAIGDLVLVEVHHNSAGTTFTGCVDSKGNTYVAGATANGGTPSLGARTQVFHSILTAALTTADTITVTPSGSSRAGGRVLAFAGPFTGNSTTVLLNTATAVSGSAGTAVSVGPTASNTGDHLSVLTVGFQTSGTSITAGSGYSETGLTDHAGPNTGTSVGGVYKLSSPTGTATGTATLGVAAGWHGVLHTFAVAAGGDPINTVPPELSGDAVIGETLTCSTGTWVNSAGFTYQWKRAGVNIGGATASTYLLVSADEGLEITCAVTSGGVTALSNALVPAGVGAFRCAVDGVWLSKPTRYANTTWL